MLCGCAGVGATGARARVRNRRAVGHLSLGTFERRRLRSSSRMTNVVLKCSRARRMSFRDAQKAANVDGADVSSTESLPKTGVRVSLPDGFAGKTSPGSETEPPTEAERESPVVDMF